MKIWLKMVIAIIIGALAGLAVPSSITWFTNATQFLGTLSINLILYISSVYIVLKVFIGFYQLKQEITNKKFIPVFIISVFGSMIFAIALSMMLFNINQTNFRIFQIKYHPVEVNSFTSIIQSILNTNILSSFVGQTRYLSPLIFTGLILGITSLFANKKMELFIEVVLSFEQFVDKVARAFIEFFPILATFMIAYLFNTGFLNTEITKTIMNEKISFANIGKTIFVITLASTIVIAIFGIILKIVSHKSIRKDLLGILGTSLIAFTTANTITTVIPLTESLQKNNGVSVGFAKVFTPICVLLNRTGTVIVTAISIMTIINAYHINKVSISLQIIIALLIFAFSFRLDGSNGLGFILLVVMILQFKPLKLEENGYLMFMIFLPLLNRLAIFVDTITTSMIVIICAKIANLKEDTKYIDSI